MGYSNLFGHHVYKGWAFDGSFHCEFIELGKHVYRALMRHTFGYLWGLLKRGLTEAQKRLPLNTGSTRWKRRKEKTSYVSACPFLCAVTHPDKRCRRTSLNQKCVRTRQMVQRGRALAVKPDGLTWGPKTDMLEDGNWLTEAVLWPAHMCPSLPTLPG